MERAICVAQYICDEYRKMAGEPIDEMKLHKLLYFAQRESLAITGEPLFADQFEGWRYGPVCVTVRQDFCNGEILGNNHEVLSPPSAYIVDNILTQYGALASWKLSKLSHEELSWQHAREGLSAQQNGNKPLELSDIQKDAEKVRPYDSVWDMYYDEFDDDEEEQ